MILTGIRHTHTPYLPASPNDASRIESFERPDERIDPQVHFSHRNRLAFRFWFPTAKKNRISNYEFRFNENRSPWSMICSLRHTIACRIYCIQSSMPIWAYLYWCRTDLQRTGYGVRISQAKPCTNLLDIAGSSFSFTFWRNDDWLCLWLVACIAYMHVHSAHTHTRLYSVRDFPLVYSRIKGCVNNEKRKKKCFRKLKKNGKCAHGFPKFEHIVNFREFRIWKHINHFRWHRLARLPTNSASAHM